jgi:nucleotide-binding universal stress UspA family protein
MLPLNKIVCPTDFSEPADEGIKIAGELATEFSAQMLLVNVVAPLPAVHAGAAPTGYHIPAVLEEMELAAKNSLTEIRHEKLPADIEVRIFVIQGRPAPEIAALAKQKAADMIVMATHGESGWQRLVFGSVAEKVVRLAACPVLTIRKPDSDEE